MGRYLDMLLAADAILQKPQKGSLQNLQNPETGSFVGFDGTPPSVIEKKQALLVLPEHEEIPIDPDALDRYRHLVQCQNCAHLSANGRCKVKVDYKPIPDAKQDCSRHQLLQETRQPVADAPYTPDELHALMRRQEDQLLNHLVHCPDCRASDRRWCAHGFTIGSAYDALLMVFDDADDRHQTFVDRVIRKRLEGCK
jgi:hypothetical protein